MAILYRTNSQSRAFEEAFRRAGIPYRLVGAVSFYDRREVKDLLAYLRLVANPSDDEAFLRAIAVPRRGIGDASLAILREVGDPVAEAAPRNRLALPIGSRDCVPTFAKRFAGLPGSSRTWPSWRATWRRA